MKDWNPDLYTRFEAERTRPARDLLSRIPPIAATSVVDLGCGPGNSTELLVDRFPEASVLGLDSSPSMIASSRTRLPAIRFEEADLAVWTPDSPPDVIFANAVLQWLPDHAALIPRLFAILQPGGVLAIQMPDNLDEPSHRLMRTVAKEEPWAEQLAGAAAARTMLPPLSTYYDMLCPFAESVDVWRTAYHHPMASASGIVDWVRATGLKPFLDALGPEAQREFLMRYESRIEEAYPPQSDGQRLLAFPRVFIVAQRRSF